MNIYIIHNDRGLSEKQFGSLISLVTEERRTRIEKYRFYKDAQRSLLGDMLIRYAARKCLAIHNDELVFGKNEYGKPFLISHPSVQYNISHAGDYVVCAVTDGTPIGVDVEIIKPIGLDIAERFFSRDEYAYVAGQPSEMQTWCFYWLWTRKESYIKMVGKGLSIPLNSFSVLRDTGLYFREFIKNNEVIGNICTREQKNVSCEVVNHEELFSVLGL